MPDQISISPRRLWIIRVTGIVIYLFFAALVARTFAEVDDRQVVILFLVSEAIFLAILTLNILVPKLPDCSRFFGFDPLGVDGHPGRYHRICSYLSTGSP